MSDVHSSGGVSKGERREKGSCVSSAKATLTCPPMESVASSATGSRWSAEPTRDARVTQRAGEQHQDSLPLSQCIQRSKDFSSEVHSYRRTWWLGPAALTGMSTRVKVLMPETLLWAMDSDYEAFGFSAWSAPIPQKDFGAPTPKGATR